MTSFIYTRGVPNPPNLPSQDVGNMQTNTNSVDDIINVDHWSFQKASPLQIDGRHRQVSLSNRVADANIPTDIGGVIFASNPAPTNISWPFWQNGPSPADVVQMLSVLPSGIQNGHTSLPGGIIIQWGFVTIPINQQAIAFSQTLTGLPFAIILTPFELNGGNTTYSVEAIPAPSTAGFNVLVHGSGLGSLYWMAIGI